MFIPPCASGASRLVLVRHGEPEASSRGRCYGRLDVGLSPEGRGQARHAAAALAGMSVAAVYASTRTRALESARLVCEGRGLEPIALEALREIDFGVFEGMRYDEAAERYPEVYRAWMERPTEVCFPGGESFPEMRRRVLAAVAEIRTRHEGETVVVVSHGGTNRVVLADALGLPDERIFRFAQSYACVNVIDYFEQAPLVVLLNGAAS